MDRGISALWACGNLVSYAVSIVLLLPGVLSLAHPSFNSIYARLRVARQLSLDDYLILAATV